MPTERRKEKMNLIGRAMEKEFWQEVREKECFKKYRENLLVDWEKLGEGNEPLIALKYSEFKMFFTNGNRSVYQASYGRHGFAVVVSALLSLIYPEEDKYVNFLMDAIYTTCDEYTWCLPAHQGNLEENNNSVIDLCAAAMGYCLAEVDTLLGDRLDPLIRSRIRAELDRRIFTPFLSKQPYSWWETGTSNWTAVCMGSVACAFMLMKPELARELLPRFEKSMEGFVRGFSDEGVCLEGGGYWNYGFGNFLFYADMVRTFTEGEIDYFKMPKIMKVATFYQKIFLTGNILANFADCGARGSFVIGRMHYLKAKFPEDMKSTGIKYSSFSHTSEFPTRLREALWFYEEDEADSSDRFYSEFFAPEANWLIKRTPCYGFAAKGGNNAEHHNHNDVGHFIFAVNERQILCDLGSAPYVRDYFGVNRYTFLETNSRGHSVPIIDGEYQGYGKEFAARALSYENGILSIDIAGAYASLGEDEKIERSFAFSDNSVTLTDKFSFNKERRVTERFITRFLPDISEEGTVKIEEVTLKYDSRHWVASVEKLELATEGKFCYAIDLSPRGALCDFVCEIEV